MTDSRSSTTTADAGTPRQRAIQAYESARGSVSDVGRRASDTLTEAPLIALAGGVAVGALFAALLPATEAEERLVGPTARRVRQGAKAAVGAAREAGTQRLGELGLTREKGEEAIRSLLDNVSDAAKTSARAAADAAKNAG